MKKLNYIIFLTIILFFSCSTNTIFVEVLKPADITVPPHIKKLTILNRSLPGKGNKLGNILEGVISGEALFVDRQASFQTIYGLNSTLLNSPRFSSRIATNVSDIKGTGTAQFPSLISWQRVNLICNENDADALIVLATFDSDSKYNTATKEKSRTKDGKIVKYLEHIGRRDIRISAGWRIYDPIQRTIIDENVYYDSKGWEGRGKTPEEAERRTLSQREAVKEAGHHAGERYAFRISPLWIKVSREYFTKGTDNFKIAKDNVQNNMWTEAEQIWRKSINYTDKKISGRATFNIALSQEINGNLRSSLEWAKKSYYSYGNKKARRYINTIQRRIADQERLKEQMDGSEN